VLVTKETIKAMKPGAVVVDVAIDQGGCIETVHPTTHAKPTFIVSGVVHYCVANMPGAVGRTSTFALTNATFPYALKIANLGAVEAIRRSPALAKGLNMFKGKVTYKAVADTFGLEYVSVDNAVN
jgi:alanine dehydrogenase